MDQDKKLEQQINEYQAVAKDNPDVNIGMLMMNALQNQKDNMVSSKGKRWAYFISLSVPFSGFVFALKYFMADEDDAKQVAWICIILTVVSLLMLWLGGKLLLSGSGTSLEQIRQIKTQDIMQLTQ